MELPPDQLQILPTTIPAVAITVSDEMALQSNGSDDHDSRSAPTRPA